MGAGSIGQVLIAQAGLIGITTLEQLLDDVAADETRAAGDQDARSLSAQRSNR